MLDVVLICTAGTCTKPAQPEHTPCCSSKFHGAHGGLCCEHYCRSHHVEANPCSPETHSPARDATKEDGTPCCPDPGCSGNPCTFPGYATNH